VAARNPPWKKPDTTALRAQLAQLLDDGQGDTLLETVLSLVEQMASQNDELAWRLQAALSQLYRKKSEKISPDQLSLFLAKLSEHQAAQAQVELVPDEECAPEPASGNEPKEPEPPEKAAANKPGANKPHKKPFPDHLRREIQLIPVPPAQCTCGKCSTEAKPIGYEKREIWEYKPGEFYVIEERLEKRAYNCCQEGVVTAEGTPKPIEGGRPGPGLLAQIVSAKFREGMPLYRQSQSYQEKSGITLATSTLGDWVAAAADLYEPVHQEARRRTLTSYLMSLDDTGMPVLTKEHPRGIRRGHIWTYIGDEDQVAFCAYTPTWQKEGPLAVLSEFTGEVVQGDGYAGIDAYFKGHEPPIRAGCMDHCRRKFVQALKGGHPSAAVAVSLIGKLYHVEAEARRAKVDPSELLQRRQQLSRPVMDQLGRAVADLRNRSVPKSPIGKATTYAINQWQPLSAFLNDPRIPLSNGHVERQQRRTAIMRKASLFAGSDEGGRRMAILETAVINCDLCGAPLFDYLRDVFAKLAGNWPNARIGDLLPGPWPAERDKS
jgi:transposase